MPETHHYAHCGHRMHGSPFWAQMMTQYGNFMPYDLEETDDNYTVTMPLPGFRAKDIKVSVAGKAITIEAAPPQPETASPPNENAESRPKVRKVVAMGDYIWNRPIKVTLEVTDEIQDDNVKAHLTNGLLDVTFQKRPKKTFSVEEE